MKHLQKIFVTIIIISVTIIGCGQKNPFGTVPVSGVVTLDGKPAEKVNVHFLPVPPNTLGAYGTTQADGSFVLTTGGAAYGGGAQPGTYNVTLSKTDVEEKYKRPVDATATSAEIVIPPLIYVVPQHYNDPKTSGIEPVTVDKGKKNHFRFEVESQ